ncbi:MAG: helix-turn-helix domain-containing protein [Blautia sp.]|nr:helix-turn-helix domain-containing protein [Blautia sp.]
MEIKDILRNKRIEMDMTMKELAEKVGVSEGTISRWEAGEISNMRRDKIAALADALGISPLVVLGVDEDPKVPADGQSQSYYEDPKARELAEFLHCNPDYSALFDAAKSVPPEDLEFVRQMIERMGGKD